MVRSSPGGGTRQITRCFMRRQRFVHSGHVVNTLIRENVIENAAMSKKNIRAIQTIFNE